MGRLTKLGSAAAALGGRITLEDSLLACGVGLLGAGAALVYLPAGLLVAGVLLLAGGLRLGRAGGADLLR